MGDVALSRAIRMPVLVGLLVGSTLGYFVYPTRATATGPCPPPDKYVRGDFVSARVPGAELEFWQGQALAISETGILVETPAGDAVAGWKVSRVGENP